MHHHSLVSRLATAAVALIGLGAGACATDDLGTIGLSLVGQSPSGTVYNLRNAEVAVTGPAGTLVFRSEDDPYASHFTAHVQAGSYTADLADGWFVERIADGVGTLVEATLTSPDPAPFEVAANATAHVPLRFRIVGDDVNFGQGDFDITAEFDDTPESPVGPYAPLPDIGSFSPNYLLGTSIQVPNNATLRGFGFYSYYDSGALLQLALYRDVGGQPAGLVAQSAPAQQIAGRARLDVAPVALPAGRYWLMSIYDREASGVGSSYAASTEIKYISLGFGNGIPDPFPAAHDTYIGGPFNYYVNVTYP